MMNDQTLLPPAPGAATFWQEHGALKADVDHLKAWKGQTEGDIRGIKDQLVQLAVSMEALVDDHKKRAPREELLFSWVEDRMRRDRQHDGLLGQVRALALLILGTLISAAFGYGVYQAQHLRSLPPAFPLAFAAIGVLLAGVVLFWRPRSSS